MGAAMNLRIGSWRPRVFESPGDERLLGSIEAVDADVGRRISALATGEAEKGWAAAATQHIANARTEFDRGNRQIAWREINAADRVTIEDPNDKDGAVAKATVLFQEADSSVLGRRSKEITALLAGQDGKLSGDLVNRRATIVQAAALRDEHYDTLYFKIQLRRRHLLNLLFILMVTLVALVGLAYAGRVELFDKPDRLVIVILFGVLGAAMSVAQAMISSDVYLKITAQQVGAFTVWMRPTIGAAAAVAAYTLLLANDHFHILSEGLAKDFSAIAVIALVAGFSERFIVGALGRVAESQDPDTKGSPAPGKKAATK
jgi:hypothetical protein